MNKKEHEKNREFYERYIQDNRTDDEIMMDIIHDNARKQICNKLHCETHNQRKKCVFESHKGIFIINLIEMLLLILILVKLCV